MSNILTDLPYFDHIIQYMIIRNIRLTPKEIVLVDELLRIEEAYITKKLGKSFNIEQQYYHILHCCRSYLQGDVDAFARFGGKYFDVNTLQTILAAYHFDQDRQL